MAKVVAKAFDPKSGMEHPVYEGFSWWALLFGFFFLLYKAAYVEAAAYFFTSIGISIVISSLLVNGGGADLVSLSLSVLPVQLVFAAMANSIVANSYVRKGFLTEKQWLARKIYSMTPAAPRNTAEEISKLADLKERGLLSTEEYQKLKSKVID